MPLLEFRCREDGTSFEQLSPRSARTAECACGSLADRVFSTFAIKQYQIDHSTFALIAPHNADGKPMTEKEASRVKSLDRYNSSERARIDAEDAAIQQQAVETNMARAKREAWAEVTGKRRIVVNGQ